MKSRHAVVIGDGNHRPSSPAKRVEARDMAFGIFSTPGYTKEA
jgi:hypothetical protein